MDAPSRFDFSHGNLRAMWKARQCKGQTRRFKTNLGRKTDPCRSVLVERTF
jgi:hypothetical protein